MNAGNSMAGYRATAAGVGLVAACAAVISYRHVQHLARQAGETPAAALLLPLALDGAIAAAVAVILADSRRGHRTRPLTWLLLTLGLSGSLAANIASAQPEATARVIAAWPPLLLAVGVEALAGLTRPARAAPEPAEPAEPAEPEQAEPEHTPEPRPAHRPDLPEPGTPGPAAPHVRRRDTPARRTRPAAGTAARAAALLDRWSATGEPATGARLAAELDVSDSYARRLIRDWQRRHPEPLHAA
jgi:outer membrane biosynthesis protein TonB